MKRIFTALLVIVELNSVGAQDSTDYYIDRLSCSSFFLKIKYVTEMALDREAEAIVVSQSPGLIKRLIKEMKNKEKIAAIHAILTKRMEPEKLMFATEVLSESNEAEIVVCKCNGFKWRYNFASSSCSVDLNEIEQIRRYWKLKVRSGKKSR